MFKILYLISLLITLSACTSRQYETVEIIGKNSQNNQIVVRGMGVEISGGSILTSAHVVRDGGLSYEISGIRYQVSDRDIVGDRAILITSNDLDGSHHSELAKNPSQYSGSFVPQDDGGSMLKKQKFQNVQKGDTIYIEVSRSGSIVKQVGKVVDPSGSVVGYDEAGRVVTLSGIVLTDLDLQPGDSGAPIYTMDRQLVDVVHVR